jgi:uncharacterized protein (TIGR04255 family)
MAVRHKYRNDPIAEALCEIHFDPSTEWDLTLPGRFYERVKDTYGGKPRQQGVMEAGFQVGAQANNPSLQLRGGFGKFLFPTEDDLRLVGIGPDVLSVHVLKPYPFWEDFYMRIQEAVQAYQELVEPRGVRSISIRYINRVMVEGTAVDLGDYFTTAPATPPNISLTLSNFLSRIESAYTDRPARLNTTLGSVDAPDGYSAFVLDLEVSQEWAEKPLTVEEAFGEVNELRVRERDAFEYSITDRTREVFDAE